MSDTEKNVIRICDIHGKYVENPIGEINGCMGCNVADRYNHFDDCNDGMIVKGTHHYVEFIDEDNIACQTIHCFDIECKKCNHYYESRNWRKFFSKIEKRMLKKEYIKYYSMKKKDIESKGYDVEYIFHHNVKKIDFINKYMK